MRTAPARTAKAAKDTTAKTAGPDADADADRIATGRAAPAEVTAAAPAGIRFDRVTVTYDGDTVLDGLDLTVAPGEVMALLGPSGSGKTTALRAVAGFVTPAGGRVLIGGRDVTDLPPYKRGIGMVVQQYALFPHLRVDQNVAFGLKAQRVPRAEQPGRVAAALEMTGMASYARRYPRELSGGQQQRVAIARALAIRPGVLLLDEPLSALDARLRSDMLAELARLHRELPDVSILYVTHDQVEALTLADRIAVLDRARLQDIGTPHDLYRHPRTAFTATFVGNANLLRVRAQGPDTVRLGDLLLPVADSGENGPAAGAEATLCVRPHALRPVAAEPGAQPGADPGADPGPETGPETGPDPGPDPGPETGPDTDTRTGILYGTVTGVQWRGHTHRLLVQAHGHQLIADVGDLRQPPQAGDEIGLAFDAWDAVLLPGGLVGGDGVD